MDKVLRNGINQKQIKKFVENEAVQLLWVGPSENDDCWCYRDSAVLKQILQALTAERRNKVYEIFENKIQPSELMLLP